MKRDCWLFGVNCMHEPHILFPPFDPASLSLHALMRWSVTSHSCILSTKFTCDCACVGALQQKCKAPGQKHAVHFLGASPAAYESWGLVMSQWSIVESQFSDPSPSHRLTSWNGVRKSPRAAAERGKWKCASWIQHPSDLEYDPLLSQGRGRTCFAVQEGYYLSLFAASH